MPSRIVKKIASKCGKSTREVEAMWNEVKTQLHKSGAKESDTDFYSKLVGIVKLRLSDSCLDKLGWSASRKSESRRHLREKTSSDEDEVDLTLLTSKELSQKFRQENPLLIDKVRHSLKTRNYKDLLKKLGAGLFWTAAVAGNPNVIGGGLLLKALLKRRKRKKELQDYLKRYGQEPGEVEEEEGSISALGAIPHVVHGVIPLPCPYCGSETSNPSCKFCRQERKNSMVTQAESLIRQILTESSFCTFHFKQRGSGASSPATTVHIKHALNMGGCVEGIDYQWQGPYILHIMPHLLNRDILQVLQVSGAEQTS